jgi:hypothetical protein
MAKLYLTGVHSTDKYVLVDKGFLPMLNQFKWYYMKGNYGLGYAVTALEYKTYRMHRMIMGVGNNPRIEVDHINGNTLDNRIRNLRRSSKITNRYNRRKVPGTTSRYKGVHKDEGRWVASIGFKRKVYYLGRYRTEREAAEVYNKKAVELHGQFASINNL